MIVLIVATAVSTHLTPAIAQDFRSRIPERSRALYDKAVLAQKQNRQDEAFAFLDKLVSDEKNCYAVLQRASELYAQNGQYEKSIECATAALKQQPGSVESWFVRGFAYYQLGEHKAAARDLTQCIDNKLHRSQVYTLRAECYRAQGVFGRAIEDYRTAYQIEADPSRLYLIGECRCELGEYAAAEMEFKKLTNLHPKYARAHIGVGFALLMQDKVQSANTSFSKAIEMDESLAENVKDIKAWYTKSKE